jgi:hypothetical protein
MGLFRNAYHLFQISTYTVWILNEKRNTDTVYEPCLLLYRYDEGLKHSVEILVKTESKYVNTNPLPSGDHHNLLDDVSVLQITK